MADTPTALQLRLLETVVEVAAEKNSTLVLPFPVELLRFLERIPGTAAPPAEPARTDGPAAVESAPDRPALEDVGAIEPRAAARTANGQPA